VLLASGIAVPIDKLKVGDKVLATNAKTGKTQAETVAAVLVHHDTNLYNLRIRTGNRTAVIHTTRNHLFWDVTRHQWIQAAALHPSDHLRTPAGAATTVIGGSTPTETTGWMWDLTIPGDHDFYIDTTAAPVLVHNCRTITGYRQHARDQMWKRGMSQDTVEQTVDRGRKIRGNTPNTWKYILGKNWVVLNKDGVVVSVGRN
jgi:hypothetical protein